ncbi:MAG: hypothetical protein KDA85_07985 [Planctomycetaceae bacterium]|nr:hypothetical protein [Planctomycetaceae bacterium]
MLKDRKRIERQLEAAQQKVQAVEKQLESNGVTGKQLSRDPKWRHVKADYRQLKRRLLAVAAVEQREADAQARKAAKLSGDAESAGEE